MFVDLASRSWRPTLSASGSAWVGKRTRRPSWPPFSFKRRAQTSAGMTATGLNVPPASLRARNLPAGSEVGRGCAPTTFESTCMSAGRSHQLLHAEAPPSCAPRHSASAPCSRASSHFFCCGLKKPAVNVTTGARQTSG